MPKVYLSKQEKLNDRLSSWVYGQMKVKGLKQHDLAEILGISQQVLSYKLKSKRFTFKDFTGLVDALEPDTSEIGWLLGKGG